MLQMRPPHSGSASKLWGVSLCAPGDPGIVLEESGRRGVGHWRVFVLTAVTGAGTGERGADRSSRRSGLNDDSG